MSGTSPFGFKGLSDAIAETPIGTRLQEAADQVDADAQAVETARAQVETDRAIVEQGTVDALAAVGATQAARDASALSAAQAASYVNPITTDPTDTSAEWRLFDTLGFIGLLLSGGGKDLRGGFGRLRALTDGTLRIERPDGTTSIDLTAAGLTFPGGAVGPSDDARFAVTWTDFLGFLCAAIGSDGAAYFGGFKLAMVGGAPTLSTQAGQVLLRGGAAGGAVVGGLEVWSDARTDVLATTQDALGFWGEALLPDGSKLTKGAATTAAFTAADIADEDQRARLAAAERLRQVDASSARPVVGLNDLIIDGQSLSAGWDSVPIRSTVAPYASNLMLGGSVHSAGGAGITWTPSGAATLQPLRETVLGSGGETIATQALAFLKRAMGDERGLAEDTERKLTAGSVGYGGRTWEQLSKGATPNEYNRVPTYCAAMKAAANGASLPYQILSMVIMQGEYNYTGTNSGSSDKAAFKAGWRAIVENVRTDCQVSIAGQARPFSVYTYQTGAQYTRDSTNLSIGMAQWEMSEEEPNWYLVGPIYPYPDHSGHITANSEAWFGQMVGKVKARVLLRGERWRPLSPLTVRRRGREVLVAFHVPAPPLVFRSCYVGKVATMFANKGFAVLDNAGAVGISVVEIVAPTVIRITLSRDTSSGASPRLRYAGEATYGGHGNVADSDATEASANYVYDPAAHPSEDIPELVGKPYPLWNWSVAYELPILDA